MSDSHDLFGKIDALFEKRAPDVLLDKGLEHEDFPVLTEVVAAQEEENAQARATERRARDRRLGDRRQSAAPLTSRPQASGEDFEQLVTAVEQRLSELFIRQQLRMEDAVRKAIRDELAKTGKPL